MAGKTPGSHQSAFGDLLKQHRSAAGLTQDQLAERADVSARSISDLERGVKRYPHGYTLQRLASALDLAPEERDQFEAAARRTSKTPTTMHAGDGSPGVLQIRPRAPAGQTSAKRGQFGIVAIGLLSAAVALIAVAILLVGTHILVGTHRTIPATGNTSDGSGLGQFHGPTGIALDGKDNLYVVDRGNSRIEGFHLDGVPFHQWGASGFGPLQFNGPGDVAANSRGDLYVGNQGNSNVVVIHAGRQVNEIEHYGGGLALDRRGNLYIMNAYRHEMFEVDAAGNDRRMFRLPGVVAGRFPYPAGLAVDSRGFIYLADRAHDRIVKLSPDGRMVAHFGSFGRGPRQFNKPTDVAVDGKGNLYVADAKNDRIEELSSNGRFLRQWGTPGSGPRQFLQPDSIALDMNGNVYVSDYYNDRVQKFSATGTFIWATRGRHPVQRKTR